jgi:hypothetical protein
MALTVTVEDNLTLPRQMLVQAAEPDATTSLLDVDAHPPLSVVDDLEFQSGTPSAIRKLTLVSVSLVILQTLLTVGFVAYIWSNRVLHCHMVIIVNIPNNLLLLFSTILSRVTPIIVPFAMSSAAYTFANDWLVLSS